MTKILLSIFGIAAATFFLLCQSPAPFYSSSDGIDSLNVADVMRLTVQAVEQASRQGVAADIAVTDRAGNVLSVYRMIGSRDSNVNPLFGSIARARTAAFLSSNQHAFSSLTACYITRQHFPPGVPNVPGGPLYGVVWSQLGGGDIQPNGGSLTGQVPAGQPGLTGIPGGFPIYKNGVLVGGLGVAGGALDVPNTLVMCSGASVDEVIALSALTGYAPAALMLASNVTIDGVALLYTNAMLMSQTYSFRVDTLASIGVFDTRYLTISPVRVVSQGYRVAPVDGFQLTADEVASIIETAAARSVNTRAQIRRPASSPARVWIAVVDVATGKVLGQWRDSDAAVFGMDVSVQKARTALSFSDPLTDFGVRIRTLLQMDLIQPLAVSTRTVGWLAQDFYPPGIDGMAGVTTGPWFEGANFSWQQRLAPTLAPYGNGFTIFPGGIPLYKAGVLVGAIGVSGDGVDQDDYIAAAGSAGFEPWPQYRIDNFSYAGARLPYVKFPRSPDLR